MTRLNLMGGGLYTTGSKCIEVKAKMFGWMTVFAMISVSSAGMALLAKAMSPWAWLASIVFAILFLLGLFSRVLRRKSW